MIIRLLSQEEKFSSSLISTYCFHGRVEDPEKLRQESMNDLSDDWGAFSDDGRLMAHVINNAFTVYLNGEKKKAGGIGAVSTLAEYRRSGAIRAIMQKILPSAYENGEIVSTLFPFNHSFYRKFGYETVCFKNTYEFAPEALAWYQYDGEAVLWHPGDPTEEYTDLYNRYAAQFNLALVRSDEFMQKTLFKEEWYKDRKFHYLLKDQEGKKVLAYLIFQDIRHDPAAILSVSDLAWDGREGFYAILGFLARFTADYGTIRLDLPAGIELYHFIQSPDAYRIKKETSQNFMGRVINARKVLEGLRIPQDCAITIRITDTMIDANNGTWELSAAGVRKLDAASAGCPDLSLSIQAFSQLAVGASDLHEISYRNDVDIQADTKTLEVLKGLFIKKPIMVQDHY